MGDIGDYWREHREHRERQKRKQESNRTSSLSLLIKHGVAYRTVDGDWFKIESPEGEINFCPATGRWIRPCDSKEGRGVFELLRFLGIEVKKCRKDAQAIVKAAEEVSRAIMDPGGIAPGRLLKAVRALPQRPLALILLGVSPSPSNVGAIYVTKLRYLLEATKKRAVRISIVTRNHVKCLRFESDDEGRRLRMTIGAPLWVVQSHVSEPSRLLEVACVGIGEGEESENRRMTTMWTDLEVRIARALCFLEERSESFLQSNDTFNRTKALGILESIEELRKAIAFVTPYDAPPEGADGGVGQFADLVMRASQDRIRFIMQNRERLIEAWIASTGIRPERAVLVEQQNPDGSVSVTIKER